MISQNNTKNPVSEGESKNQPYLWWSCFPAANPSTLSDHNNSICTNNCTVDCCNSTIQHNRGLNPTPAYDFQAELDCISTEIENNLKSQFDALFNQMESKIEKLMQQQAQNHKEQQKVNAQNAKQLAWVVDNMKCFLKCTVPTSSPLTLSPVLLGDGQA